MLPTFINKAASLITKSPLIAAGTMTAAVAAPFFARNEDRGYLRTALLTTPAVLATGLFAPSVIGSARDISSAMVRTKNIFRSGSQANFSKINFQQLTAVINDPASTKSHIQKAMAEFLATEPKGIGNLEVQRNRLESYFYHNFVKSDKLLGNNKYTSEAERNLFMAVKSSLVDNLHEAKGRLLTNALHSARLSSLTPGEWAVESADYGKVLSNNEMIRMYEGFKGRDAFTKTLTNRLREVRRMNDTGRKITMDMPKAFKTILLDADDAWGAVDKAFFQQRPTVMKNLQTALKKGYIQSAEITAEAVKSGEIGRVLNVKIMRKGNIKPLVLHIVDPRTGQVRLDNASGVGNRIIDPSGVAHYVDEWGSKLLSEDVKFVDQAGADITHGLLQKEINAHSYYLAGDPLDAFRMAELTGAGEGMMSEAAIKLRSMSAAITSLPMWKNQQGEAVNVRQLSAIEKLKANRDILNSGRYIGMGSESGISDFRYQLREAANLSPLGAVSADRQDPFWRSMTKDMTLRSKGELSVDAKLKWSSTAWKGLTGSDTLPAANFTVASINPQDRMLFADLPTTAQGLAEAYPSILKDLESKGMSSQNAKAMFAEISGIYSRGEQGALKDFGRMGETGFVLKKSFADKFYVEGRRKYKMDMLARDSGTVGVDDVLGYTGAERVVPEFPGVIEDAFMSENGEKAYATVVSKFPMQGAKIDVAGVKGMVPRVNEDAEFNTMRDLINSFYKKTGRAAFIPETVNTLAPTEYFANKVEPTLAYLGISGDVLGRLEGVGAGEASRDYLSELAKEGINGQLVIDAARNPMRDEEAAARLIRFAEINDRFFRNAGDAIKKAGDYLTDPVLSAFAKSGNPSLRDFYMQSNLPGITFAWDHSVWNLPSQATVSHDVSTYLAESGNFRSLKELNSRVRTITGGDANKGKEFLKYINAGDYSAERGVTVSIKDAFHSRSSLTEAKSRDLSIFDPSVAEYKNDFRLDLGGGKYLPVPGTTTYGAEASMFAPGRYEVHDFQRAIHDLYKAETIDDAAINNVLETYKIELGAGKHSVFRPVLQDPLGMSGFLSTTAEKIDPYTAHVSEGWVAKLHDANMREALNPGGRGVPGPGIYGALVRQPVQGVDQLHYVMSPRLKGTMDVAVDEIISRPRGGDQDKDLVTSFLWPVGSEAEAEAKEAISSGRQIASFKTWATYKGETEIARDANDTLKSLKTRMTNEDGTGFADRIFHQEGGLAELAGAPKTRVDVALNRTAASEIGSYSNILTGIHQQMIDNPAILKDRALTDRLSTGFFDVRQAPINARKAKSAFDVVTADAVAGHLRRGLGADDPTRAAKSLQKSMINITESLASSGTKQSGLRYWNSVQGFEDLEALTAGRTEVASIRTKILISIAPTTENAKEQIVKNLGRALPKIDEVMGPIHSGGHMATIEASKLGKMSEIIASVGREGRSATGKVGDIIAKHGTSLAIGFGALAALGVALTPRRAPMASFSRASSNSYRPEHQIGVSDHIPGEAIPGQMSSNPPRRQSPTSANVKTAIVAPLGRTSDLSVKTTTTDRDRTTELIRQVAHIPSGDSNVTVNYKDNSKMKSLRFKDRVREILG